MEEISIRKIKGEIAASDVTQTAIAKKLELTSGNIAQLLTPNRNTGVNHLNKIIRAYNELNNKK